MTTLRLGWLLVSFYTPLCSAFAQGIIWDQQNLAGRPDTYFTIPFASPVGQQFTPSLSAVQIVEKAYMECRNLRSSASVGSGLQFYTSLANMR